MRVKLVRDDISNMGTDAIVIPANPKLKEGSGSSKAIFERAGRQELQDACKELTKRYGKIRVGAAMPTLGFGCNAKYIIHAVVPKWIDGDHDEYDNLCLTYISLLNLADSMDCSSLAVPLLASGNNGFDADIALQIAIKCIEDYEPKNKLNAVYLTVFGHSITRQIKEKGLAIEEHIDSSYELGKNEQIIRPTDKAAEEIHKLADLYIIDGLKKGLQYIERPETIEMAHRYVGDLIKELVKQ